MADRKITDLTALAAGSQATGDLLTIVDVSEGAAADKNKKITVESLFKGIPGDVGIGTSSPVAKFHIARGSDDNSILYITGADTSSEYVALGVGANYGMLTAGGSGSTSTDLIFRTANSGTEAERLRIDSSGRLLVGTSTAGNNYRVTATNYTPQVQLVSNTVFGLAVNRTNGDANISIANSGTAAIDNTIGRVTFNANDGTNLLAAAHIVAQVDGTPGSNDMPGRLVFSTTADNASSPTERMRIDSSGNVGIGTTSASDKLSVAGSSSGEFRALTLRNSSGSTNSTASLTFEASSGTEGDTAAIAAQIKGVRLGSGTNGGLQFWTANGGTPAERMRIDSSGRLLIGATSSDAQAKLVIQGQVSNTAAGAILSIQRGEAASSITSGEGIGNIAFTDNANKQFASINVQADGTAGTDDYPGRILFQTTADGASTPGTKMIINRNGECRIGHGDSDPVSGDRVHSIGDPNLGAVTSNLARLVMQERASNWISFKSGGGTHYGSISQNGSGGVSYGSNSDYRLKNNVQNFTGGIALVKQLRPVTFNWNELSGNSDTTSTQRGFLAHEVQAVEPTAVTGNKDEMDRYGDCYDAEGRKTQTNVFEHQAKEGETWTFQSEHMRDQQLDPAKLVPILTAALQEAIAEIETLKTKVAALEAG